MQNPPGHQITQSPNREIPCTVGARWNGAGRHGSSACGRRRSRALAAWYEGCWAQRPGLDMGFANHGGMWGDLMLLPIANAVIVPHLTMGPWIAGAAADRGHGVGVGASPLASRASPAHSPRAHVARRVRVNVVRRSVMGRMAACAVRLWRVDVAGRLSRAPDARPSSSSSSPPCSRFTCPSACCSRDGS